MRAQASSEPFIAQAFFDYLLNATTDIGTDAAAQDKWLAEPLKAQVNLAVRAVEKARKSPGVDGPYPRIPGNRKFLDAWDPPSQCAVLGGARKNNRDRVEMLCSWGPKTEYAGTTRRYTLVFAREGGADKVLDVVPHDNEYTPDSQPLSQALKDLIRDANALSDHAAR